MLIPAQAITLTRAEGPLAASLAPVTCLSDPAGSCWQQANAVLRRWARTAPQDGTYHKCDFVVTYADGETYTGRYDLTRSDETGADLGGHLARVTGLYRGQTRLPEMSDEDWAAWRAHIHTCPEVVAEYRRFRASYEICVRAQNYRPLAAALAE